MTAEEATIRATIMDLDAQLGVASDLTNNIKVLRTLHSEQMKRIDLLLPEINESSQLLIHALTTHKKLLSPIRRIPAEILRHIFSFTVEFPDQLQCKDTHVIKDASGIRWLGYPQLWAQITIVFSKKEYSSIEKKPVLRSSDGQAQRHSLVGTTSTPIGSQKIIAFEACSQLDAISIVDVPNMLEWFVLPWTGIEHFQTFHAHLPCHWSSTNCPSMHEIVTSIQKTRELRECHVCLQSPGLRAPLQSVESVVYSHLSALSVHAVGTLISSFLDHISAPLLTDLTIKVCPPPSSERTKKLAPGYIPELCSHFIQQCESPLVSLRIEYAVLASDSLACILQAAPTLSEIDLKNCGGLNKQGHRIAGRDTGRRT
ncbi:hypothetical protein CPB85DRAFT_1462211 [Mucidula mucida]|nr:hypothetical protein CPB85DRAFT_1462211 [Mucidula mucida]